MSLFKMKRGQESKVIGERGWLPHFFAEWSE